MSRKFKETMKNTLFYIILLAVIWNTGACASKAGNQKESPLTDLPEIKKRGELVALTLYGPVSCFNYRGEPMGLQYELCKLFAQSIGVGLRIETAGSSEELVRRLQAGEGDLIACNLLITGEKKDSLIYCGVETLTRQVLVQRNGRNALKDVTEMPGKEIHVNPGRYLQRLNNLDNELGGGLIIRTVSEDSLSEVDLIELVAQGEIDYTVCDNEIARISKTCYPNLNTGLDISFNQRSSWAVRKSEPLLAQAADEWFKKNKASIAGLAGNRHHFEQSWRITHGSVLSVKKGQISHYDELFKTYAGTIGWDWKLLAALAYAESNFDPKVTSGTGARGLMQLMPRTARNLGVPEGKEDDPEESIKAACRLISQLDRSFSAIKDKDERINFILASYNAGEGHIRDAMALAEKYGSTPLEWENSVEKYLKLKSNGHYFNDPVCKNGYFRGDETCGFVRDIRYRHDLYKKEIKN